VTTENSLERPGDKEKHEKLEQTKTREAERGFSRASFRLSSWQRVAPRGSHAFLIDLVEEL
jgi:hypothetical protein